MALQAGALRHRITVQVATEARDAHGGVTVTWATYATRWASVRPSGGREFFESAMRQAETTHEIAFRATSGVTPKMRVLFGSRVFDILSVIDVDERGRETRLTCREVL